MAFEDRKGEKFLEELGRFKVTIYMALTTDSV
jgi:hypothetical protein